MFRQMSFWALLFAAIAIGILLFRIVEPFFAPLFFAVILTILFRPFYDRLTRLLGGRRRIAALTTVAAMFILLAGLGAMLFLAGRELASTGREFAKWDLANQPGIQHIKDSIERYVPDIDWDSLRTSVDRGIEQYTSSTVQRTGEFLSRVVEVVVGMAILSLALYYFLAEGDDILQSLRAISPFAREDEWLLFRQFATISRGVVVGIFVCAFAQAALLGIGLYFAGIERVWLLVGITFLLSMIPFVGAAGVWTPTAAWLLWNGEITAGIILGLYGLLIVSTSDNLIRAYVLHESAKMHPLLALVSALGALQIVGLWGIFLGPVVAAFFFSMLQILHRRLSANERKAVASDAA
ncbi:AI-2E family transporter [Aeoliella sp. ICT_H6.2]|uniref:AI-2E family transporter n=1 Tax=Aeoliella straminimaris TaxID=2954799 RepID=A0A9X2FFT9_9BACT|nr:AI-2E family transporter [Aeoliella straminimaris]MCO6047493.1 AI-2E family transporter [Aeoliella straminimaris]